ncbi:hypothetical protein LCGC14_1005210 [marine sediment metagenome]|uniref:DSBA-like thioredoxin domain-containing protein n=1 Tax=marine sediment metagenome TaxID=412755 RepID=A0A0F9R7Z0_9ZZZZ|nr:hypothetical protein [Actinomycetota bacterium]
MLKENAKLEIIYYTDPYCTWCWGSEPVIRHIQEVYGEQVKITYKTGGLVKDMDDFYDAFNDISRIEQVAPHWAEASSKHGMPVDIKVFDEIKKDFKSTYPANIAYKAAQMHDGELADKFLRRMREAAAYEKQPIHKTETLKKLAAQVGLDADRFVKDFESREAKEAFMEDITDARSRGIFGFPTFLIKNSKGREMIIKGYRTFEELSGIIGEVATEKLVRKKPADILAFLNKYERVATREVSEVFELSDEEAEKELEDLEKKGKIKKQTAGNGLMWNSV